MTKKRTSEREKKNRTTKKGVVSTHLTVQEHDAITNAARSSMITVFMNRQHNITETAGNRYDSSDVPSTNISDGVHAHGTMVNSDVSTAQHRFNIFIYVLSINPLKTTPISFI
jgi:hypothetical protein